MGEAGLDVPTLLMMGKAGLPPTIGLAIYQANSVASVYTTLGYLIGIISILGFAIMPRAKFLQTILLNILATCFAVSIALLAIWTSVQARKHTTPSVITSGTGGAGTAGTPAPDAQTGGYNSSASAVCGIWLFFQIYLVNTLRAKYVQFTFPGIIWSIFANVSMIYGPQFTTMAQGISFAQKLLEAFLTGFAIATGVSLFIIPMTSREVVFKEMTGYVMALRGPLKASTKYLRSLEQVDMFTPPTLDGEADNAEQKKKRRPEAEALKTAVAGIAALHGKLHGDLPFAKREIALGKLGPDDLHEMGKMLRSIMLPIVGLSSVIDIFERIAESRGWDRPLDRSSDASHVPTDEEHAAAVENWHNIMQTLHEPFAMITEVIDEGLHHVLLTLQLIKPPKKSKKGGKGSNKADDVEARGDIPRPGEKGFAEYLDRKTQDFHKSKEMTLRLWCQQTGIQLSPSFFEHPRTAQYRLPEDIKYESDDQHQRHQRQLYLVLYMEFLLMSTSRAVHDFVVFADHKAESGKLSKTRLIVPGVKRMRKWVMHTFSHQEDASNDDHHAMNEMSSGTSNMYLGEAFAKRKDPEHLPPRNVWEKIGNRFRAVPHFLRSPESSFGFRVACATMSIAIVAYLRNTYQFFVMQRLFWSLIMVAISMTPTAGQSLFSFGLRVVGTAVAMVASLVIYYIVDRHVAGVLVFLWLFVSCGFYVVLKMPKFIMAAMISCVTTTLIIGYELEVRKVGQAVATSNGQPYYPIYLFAPYRLVTVAGGRAVAFIWTIFPYPISEHSEVRKTLGAALYLLANYYSVVHATVKTRIRGEQGNMNFKNSPGRKLDKAHNTVFSKQMLVLNGLRTHSAFVKFEVPIGGRFPKAQYDAIINSVQNLITCMSRISYASNTFSNLDDEGEESQTVWLRDFRRLVRSANLTSIEITSLLALLSASISSGQPLPPYLQAPQPYALSKKLEALDPDILSVRHIAEPGYAAFAVMQISTRCLIDDLKKLMQYVLAAMSLSL
ncbi:hypothetical protein BJ546DRAFT_964334 [Cryomyces antarcticus]